jgi:glycerol-3-phosphate acyltransferase PlsX
MSVVTVALDAMGGDYGIKIVIPAALEMVQTHANLCLILVGDQTQIQACLKKFHAVESDQIIIHHASQVVAMDELPSQALRYKKDSSMRAAINLVKQGKAQACVSAGNTGALMAIAHFVLKTLPGIDRPAIIGPIPADNQFKRVRILDLGANVDTTAEQLVQFAIMGSVLTSALDGIESPTVGLLNIGSEAIKGNEQVKKTAKLLSENGAVNYVGFVEGDDIFSGKADVIVCDGFVGNVALKTIEGLAKFIRKLMKNAFYKNIVTKMAGLCANFVLRSLLKKMDPSLYNGASFVGLQGIVIKSHGGTNIKGFKRAIEVAMLEVDNNVPELIKNQITDLLQKMRSAQW